MRRRSERKKSTDVSSPAPASRRTSRRSQKLSENSDEKNFDVCESTQGDKVANDAENNSARASSEEHMEPSRRGRTRNRTPVKEHASPAKRRNQRSSSSDQRKIGAIPEEENGTHAEDDMAQTSTSGEEPAQLSDVNVNVECEHDERAQTPTEVISNSPASEKLHEEDNTKPSDVLELQAEDQEKEQDDEDPESKPQVENTSSDTEKQLNDEVNNTKSVKGNEQEASNTCDNEQLTQSPAKEAIEDSSDTAKTVEEPAEYTPKDVRSTSLNTTDNGRTRKRKWLTKKTAENKVPILSISTDSLKNLIADVHPVPLSDVQLESSSDVEEVMSEREEGEDSPTPEREIRRPSIEKSEKSRHFQNEPVIVVTNRQGAKNLSPMHRTPSPPRNNSSNVLFITNLVRPFTVLQLKGLLARTGKIVEDGFWIDRIKSKCYVQYETEDEAIETRHALHGVRWPVSNPKCLNVDFGSKSDMDRAIESTKDDGPKFGQENNKDNLIVGTGWNRDDEKKTSRPVREWDVGKKESLDRDKNRDLDKRRSRDRDISGNRENERSDKERKNRSKGRERSNSLSPVRKVKKKENDPPLRLLDDLFRKTKATPCIYWLPLTPEQIAEKEAFRQKRIEEHKQRIKQRELERGKEREKERERERNRANERGRDRDREREHRRNRSSDRRSRSRDRRRY